MQVNRVLPGLLPLAVGQGVGSTPAFVLRAQKLDSSALTFSGLHTKKNVHSMLITQDSNIQRVLAKPPKCVL